MATTDHHMDLTIQLADLVGVDNPKEMVDQEDRMVQVDKTVQVDRQIQVDRVVQMDQIIPVVTVQVEQVVLLIRMQVEEHQHLDLQMDRMVRVDTLMK